MRFGAAAHEVITSEAANGPEAGETGEQRMEAG
jgi:hypothetical protein